MKAGFSFLVLGMLLFMGNDAISQKQPKGKVHQLNQVLIFDLYMNFELSLRNGNLALMAPFVEYSNKIKNTKTTIGSTLGGMDQELITTYDRLGGIRTLEYNISETDSSNNRNYFYQFDYEGLQLKKIVLNGRVVFDLKYNKKGHLKSIGRKTKSAYQVMYFIYGEKNRAELRFDILEDGKNESYDNSGYVNWDKNQKIIGCSTYFYETNNIVRNEYGDIKSFRFSGNLKNRDAIWSYKYNTAGLWIERKMDGEVVMSRIITNN